MRTGGWSLRLKLLFTVFLALTPVALVSVVQGVDRIGRDVAQAREILIASARASAGEEANLLASAEQILRALANQPSVRATDAGCSAALADALHGLGYFTNIVRTRADGSVACTARKMPVNNVSARAWWEETQKTSGFVVAQQTIGANGGPTIVGVIALQDAKRRFDGALATTIDVRWFDAMLRAQKLPEDTVVVLLDKTGSAIASNRPGVAAQIFPLGENPAATLNQLQTTRDKNGRAWSYAVAPLVTRNVFVAYAQRETTLFGATYVHVTADLVLPIFMLGLASLAIWIATDRQVTRWIVYLRRIAGAYARGHYAIRPHALDGAPMEFRELAESFSAVAAAVQDRDRALRDAVTQKTMLIKETHHRVKNNLQIVMSLLSLQAGQLRDPAAQEALRQAQIRVNALALVHRILHEVEEQSIVELKELLQDLTAQINEGFGGERRNVRIDFDMVERHVPSDVAVPLTLFAVEAITNVFKHAYPGNGGGRMLVSLQPLHDGKLCLSIEDDGVGVPDTPSKDGKRSGIGSRLIEAFAQQVGGEGAIKPRPGGGTIVSLRFADPQAETPSDPA